MLSRSKPRTELLVKINLLLKRPYLTDRRPEKCRNIIIYYEELIQAGVNPNKLECLNNIDEEELVCICQLADCCADMNICYYCKGIMSKLDEDSVHNWIKQENRHVYTLGNESVKYAAVYNPPTFHDPKGSYHEVILKNDNVKCFYGDECSYYKRGICRYKH